MKAMVLTAGKGTRLRPLTDRTHKSLLPVGGVPLLEYTLRWLRSHGIGAVVLNLHHLAQQVRAFAESNSGDGLTIILSHEERLLGTAGAVKNVAHLFDETFAVIYGDVLTNMNLSAMLDHHRRIGAVATIAICAVHDTKGKGLVEVDEAGAVRSFVEKPKARTLGQALVNAGIYIIEPELLKKIEPRCVDFGEHVFPRLLQQGEAVDSWRLGSDEYLIDIGTHETYRMANDAVARGRIRLL